jgi:hypothetical protein
MQAAVSIKLFEMSDKANVKMRSISDTNNLIELVIGKNNSI